MERSLILLSDISFHTQKPQQYGTNLWHSINTTAKKTELEFGASVSKGEAVENPKNGKLDQKNYSRNEIHKVYEGTQPLRDAKAPQNGVATKGGEKKQKTTKQKMEMKMKTAPYSVFATFVLWSNSEITGAETLSS